MTAARFVSVAFFVVASGVGVVATGLAAGEESYTSLTTPAAMAWLSFTGASLVAAALAWRPHGAILGRAGAVLLLVPALALMSEGSPNLSSPDSSQEWLSIIGAAALIVAGGVIAGGLLGRRGADRT